MGATVKWRFALDNFSSTQGYTTRALAAGNPTSQDALELTMTALMMSSVSPEDSPWQLGFIDVTSNASLVSATLNWDSLASAVSGTVSVLVEIVLIQPDSTEVVLDSRTVTTTDSGIWQSSGNINVLADFDQDGEYDLIVRCKNATVSDNSGYILKFDNVRLRFDDGDSVNLFDCIFHPGEFDNGIATSTRTLNTSLGSPAADSIQLNIITAAHAGTAGQFGIVFYKILTIEVTDLSAIDTFTVTLHTRVLNNAFNNSQNFDIGIRIDRPTAATIFRLIRNIADGATDGSFDIQTDISIFGDITETGTYDFYIYADDKGVSHGAGLTADILFDNIAVAIKSVTSGPADELQDTHKIKVIPTPLLRKKQRQASIWFPTPKAFTGDPAPIVPPMQVKVTPNIQKRFIPLARRINIPAEELIVPFVLRHADIQRQPQIFSQHPVFIRINIPKATTVDPVDVVRPVKVIVAPHVRPRIVRVGTRINIVPPSPPQPRTPPFRIYVTPNTPPRFIPVARAINIPKAFTGDPAPIVQPLQINRAPLHPGYRKILPIRINVPQEEIIATFGLQHFLVFKRPPTALERQYRKVSIRINVPKAFIGDPIPVRIPILVVPTPKEHRRSLPLPIMWRAPGEIFFPRLVPFKVFPTPKLHRRSLPLPIQINVPKAFTGDPTPIVPPYIMVQAGQIRHIRPTHGFFTYQALEAPIGIAINPFLKSLVSLNPVVKSKKSF